MGKSRSELKSMAQAAGWSLSNLAWRWQISIEHLSRLLADPNRPTYWDDAVSGLPRLTRLEAAEIRRTRLAATVDKRMHRAQHRTPQKAAPLGNGFAYQGFLVPGSVVVVTSPVPNIAGVGDEGVVRELRQFEYGEDYLIRFDNGEVWFNVDRIAEHLVETGREVPL